MKHYIYALLDGKNVIYIGISSNPANRYMQHIKSWRRSRTRIYALISDLIRNGRIPVIKVFESTTSRQTAESKERKYIKRIQPIGNTAYLADVSRPSLSKCHPTGGQYWHILQAAKQIASNLSLPD